MGISQIRPISNETIDFSSLPTETKLDIFQFFCIEELRSSICLVSKEWRELSYDESLLKKISLKLNPIFGKNLFKTSWKDYCATILNWKNSKYSLKEVPFTPKFNSHHSDHLDYLKFVVLENGQLIQISKAKNSNRIEARDLMSNEIIAEHEMKAEILDIQLKGTKLFVVDARSAYIYLDFEKPEISKPLPLKNIQFLGSKIEVEFRYIVDDDQITVKSNSESKILDVIKNKNSKILEIDTTPNHIICKLKPCYGETVIAISKKDHSEKSLSYFCNLVSQTICCIEGPFVIVKDSAHQVYIWLEQGEKFIPVPRPAEVNFKCKLPVVTYNRFSIESQPNPPVVKCYKGYVMYSYEGILSIWNIKTSEVLTQIKHEINSVVDFCTNGRQLFIYGANSEYLFYDFQFQTDLDTLI